MKNILIKAIAVLSLMSFLTGLIGCKGISCNFDDRTFASMTQEEKQRYVADYLKDAYGVDYEISEIKKRQVDVFRSEKYYFATASYGEDRFTLWISDNGEVFDTEFCLDISDDVDELLSSIVSEYWDDFYVHDNFEFNDLYIQKWTKIDDMNKMFQNESILNRIRLFLKSSNNREEDLELFEQLKLKLTNIEGVIFVYYCENPQYININSYDLNLYESFIIIP